MMRFSTIRDVRTYVDGRINGWMVDVDDYVGTVDAIADAIRAQARDAGLGGGDDWSELPLLRDSEEAAAEWQRHGLGAAATG